MCPFFAASTHDAAPRAARGPAARVDRDAAGTNMACATVPMIFLLLLISESTATPAPNLHWCSWAGPNNTLTIGGANLSTASSATIAALPSGAPTTVATGPSLQLSESAAQLVVPDELPLGAYEVTINGGAPFVCGAPDIYWAQGEGGNFSVAGSWLRVFGRNMALLDADGSTAERHRSVAAEHLAERSKRAAGVGDWEVVAASPHGADCSER